METSFNAPPRQQMQDTRMTRHLAKTVALAVLIACSADVPTDPANASQLQRDEPVRLTHSAGGLTASLDWRERAGLLALQVRSEASVSGGPTMAQRVELWRPLLREFFDQHGRRERYLLTVGTYPELSPRMAAAAVCSDSWDLEQGTPLNAASADIADWLRDARLYREVHALLDEFHYQLTVAKADAVVLCRWKEIGEIEIACGRTVPADARVPCGASFVYQLTAIP